ncbi:MAG TPA: VOC family protein [Acidimicrobiia bacterium]|nr:VOC family protein [Acidimicrobiia bacterium]
MGIGTLHCVVLDVGDLVTAERFWSEVTGLEVIGSNYAERFSWLGTPDPWHAEMILQARPSIKGTETNRCHVDITPRHGVDAAVEAIVAIGGRIKKAPSIYPRPGSLPGRRPLIDWAVMRDPFGNEFCLVEDLTPEQADAVLAAAEAGAGDDHTFRVAARVTQ